MKKLLNILLILGCSFLYAEKYRIVNTEYELEGITRQYALERNVTISDKVFNNADDLVDYIKDVKVRLENLRAFEKIETDYTISSSPNFLDIYEVTLHIKTEDSRHLIVMPYPKLDSNSGFLIKLKAKDTNFMGNLESMAGEFLFQIKDQENKDTEYKTGIGVSFDTPFKLGPFKATWTNEHDFSYTVGDSTPEWSLQMGLGLEYEFKKFSVTFDFTQSFIRDLDYEDADLNGTEIHYGDGTYFQESATIATPIPIQEILNWGKVYYKPYFKATWNWDADGISDKNDDLQSPEFTIGQKLYTSRINWIGYFRNGLDLSTSQYVSYNLQKDDIIPGFELEVLAFKALKDWGLTTDIYAQACLNGTKSIGSRLRGIADDQYFDAVGFETKKACSTSGCLVVNMDVPIKLFDFYFEKIGLKCLRRFDFQAHISPFFDFALMHNKATGTTFYYGDGFYSAGIEGVVHFHHFKGLRLRGSLGIDLSRKMPKFKSFMNQDWRSGKWYEYFIGLDLLY